MRIIAAVVVACAIAAPAHAACESDSGTSRAALVELYTSEGCSSCPPADQALMRLGRAPVAGAARIVPLALHVDYWDSIGWKDPFAQPAFAKRQDWEVRANRHRTSFTPHFFVNGREVLDWRRELDGALRDTGPAGARLQLRVEAGADRSLRVAVRASSPATLPQLYLALTESRLRTQVRAGENNGATLDHDFVVRQWVGPIDVASGSAPVERVLAPPPDAKGPLGVVAFLQDAVTAEVLQAVDTGACRAGG